MQDRPSPREGRSTYDAYAKPVLMSQPPDTKVKQRQRLLSDEQTKQDRQNSRPPTPPGKLQMSKISSMLQSSSTEGSSRVPQKQPSPANRHLRESLPTAMQNGHASNASEAPQNDQAVRQLPDDMPSPSHSDRSTVAVAEVCYKPLFKGHHGSTTRLDKIFRTTRVTMCLGGIPYACMCSVSYTLR